MEWMNHNTISPMTREPLERALVPNILIRQQVNEERGRRGLPTLPTLAELDAAIKIQSAFRAHRAQQVPLSLLPSKSYLILCLLCWSAGRSRTGTCFRLLITPSSSSSSGKPCTPPCF